MKYITFLAALLFMALNAIAAPGKASLISPGSSYGGQVTSLSPSFSWSAATPAAGTTISGYKVQLCTDQYFNSAVAQSPSNTWNDPYLRSSSITPALQNGTKYWWRVVAMASDGSSSVSDLWIIYTPLSVPNNLSTTNISTTSASISWSLVTGATGYSYKYGTANPPTTSSTTFSTSTTLTGLAPNTLYYWQVQATSTNSSIMIP